VSTTTPIGAETADPNDQRSPEGDDDPEFLISVPVGTVLSYAGAVYDAENRWLLRENWVLCDGQSLERGKYRPLFKAIGTAWGAVDDTHFNLPKLGGMFLRGATTDPNEADLTGRVPLGSGRPTDIGSVQNDEIRSHNHPLTDGGHGHRVAGGFSIRNAGSHSRGGGELTNGGLAAGDHHSSTERSNITIAAAGGAETRPRNANIHWIIRVK
jgi:microcystin-dependent protein